MRTRLSGLPLSLRRTLVQYTVCTYVLFIHIHTSHGLMHTVWLVSWFFNIYRRSHVGSVENMLTSPCCIQAGILAPPNNTTNATQKTALRTMTVCHRFDKLPPLNCRPYCHIWLAYTLEKTSASFLSAVWLS